MKESFNVKRLCENAGNEAEEIATLEKEIFSDAWSEASVRETLKRDYNYIYICCDNLTGNIKGYIIFSIVCDEAELLRLAVRHDMRGRGLGEILVGIMVEEVKKKGTADILLEVRKGNAPAINLYKKQGFYEIGVRKNYYKNPDEDAVIMKRIS